MVKLDLGSGPNKAEGFVGVDVRQFDGKVDVLCDIGKDRWPWEDGSVDEARASHVWEHLTWPERVHAFNELFRVLKVGAKAQIVIPHWNSSRYYGDPTHQSPMSEFAFYYLLKSWRDVNAPHTGYTCDFDATWGYSTHPALHAWNVERQQYAIQWFKEAAQDIIATLTKR
jgi:hypothetical protein